VQLGAQRRYLIGGGGILLRRRRRADANAPAAGYGCLPRPHDFKPFVPTPWGNRDVVARIQMVEQHHGSDEHRERDEPGPTHRHRHVRGGVVYTARGSKETGAPRQGDRRRGAGGHPRLALGL